VIVIDDEQFRLRLDGGIAWLHLPNDTRMVGASGLQPLQNKDFFALRLPF
jgi:hypothetical protein